MGHFLRPIFVAAKVVTKREQLRLKNESKRKHKGEADDDKENEDRPSKARKSSGSCKRSRKGKGKGRGRGGKVSKRKQGKGDPHNEAEDKEAQDVMDEVRTKISELKLDEGSNAENSNAKNDDQTTAIPSVTKKRKAAKAVAKNTALSDGRPKKTKSKEKEHTHEEEPAEKNDVSTQHRCQGQQVQEKEPPCG